MNDEIRVLEAKMTKALIAAVGLNTALSIWYEWAANQVSSTDLLSFYKGLEAFKKTTEATDFKVTDQTNVALYLSEAFALFPELFKNIEALPKQILIRKIEGLLVLAEIYSDSFYLEAVKGFDSRGVRRQS